MGAIFLGLVGTFALLLLSLAHDNRGVPSEIALSQSACASAASFGLLVEPQTDHSCRAQAYYKLRDSSRAILEQRVIVEIPLAQILAVRGANYEVPLSKKQKKTLEIAYGLIAACFLGLLAIGISLSRAVQHSFGE